MNTLTSDKTYNYERAIEIPLVKYYCGKQTGKRVADIGGAESLYLGWLLENDYEVTVIDPCAWHDNQEWQKYVGNPKFKVIKESIHKVAVTKEEYDFALLISAMEHFGTGSYKADVFDSPEVECFAHIQVPFLLTTPAGVSHVHGPFNDRNYSRSDILQLIGKTGKKLMKEAYFKAPGWELCNWEEIQYRRYAEIMGNGASGVGYYELQ